MVKNEFPLVSVVIPAYNVENTIIETIESVSAQSYRNVQTIVIDDGSTDNTLETVRTFISDKPSMVIYTKQNEGLAATRNYGVQYVEGEYLLFLDGDDLIDSEFIELCIAVCKSKPEVDIVTTQIQLFERENRVYTNQPFSQKALLRENCFVITSLIRTSAFREIGMFDTTLKFHEDWDMWIRMTEKYNHVVNINRPLFWYRKRNLKNSLCDLNEQVNVSDHARAYIYYKYYQKYKDSNLGLLDFYNSVDKEAYYRRKYNNIWYRKLFYQFFKGKRLD